MGYDVMEKAYGALTEAQQMIVYNLALSLAQLNRKEQSAPIQKRAFGKFAGKATATFADDWEMTEARLCGL